MSRRIIGVIVLLVLSLIYLLLSFIQINPNCELKNEDSVPLKYIEKKLDISNNTQYFLVFPISKTQKAQLLLQNIDNKSGIFYVDFIFSKNGSNTVIPRIQNLQPGGTGIFEAEISGDDYSVEHNINPPKKRISFITEKTVSMSATEYIQKGFNC